ncbi:hypothetical protein C8K36_101310 [Rhodococcus sp. OK519]|uniref:hypothetical protein n=1 Tax=Rhodococcus sp. OK519 TaxID=2135729 RepID=UPI000D3AD88D|nr:hypothetical protein C8K36_101310 [Rhodococcus sp. OK519]
MRTHATAVLTRAAAGIAVAATAALAAPSLASAETTPLVPPTMATTVDGNIVSVELTNPNLDPVSGCTAVAIDSAKMPALVDDPAKFFEPGFVSWTSGIDGATAGQTKTYTTPALSDGIYAFIGGCVSAIDPAQPALGDPQLVTIGNPLGSLGDLGGLTGSLGDLDLGALLGGLLG